MADEYFIITENFYSLSFCVGREVLKEKRYEEHLGILERDKDNYRLYKVMAKIEPLAEFILSFEGGYVNNPKDKGGATNRGVTIATWRAQGYDKDGDGDIDVNDLKLITAEDATTILRRNYWNRWKADEIKDQSVANLLVDWLWSSGAWGIKIPQQLLGVKVDGVVGAKTIAALNAQVPSYFFEKLKKRRNEYIYNLVGNNPSQKTFLAGWIRRLNAINYGFLVKNGGRKITW